MVCTWKLFSTDLCAGAFNVVIPLQNKGLVLEVLVYCNDCVSQYSEKLGVGIVSSAEDLSS